MITIALGIVLAVILLGTVEYWLPALITLIVFLFWAGLLVLAAGIFVLMVGGH